MTCLGPAPVAVLAALIVGACGKNREAAPSDAGPPNLTGATIPAGRGDAAPEAVAEDAGDASAAEPMRVSVLGAALEDTGGDRGATVTRVAPGSQAASVLRPGDVITAVGLVRVHDADELARYLDKARRGVVLLTVEREGTARYVVVTRPD